MIASMLRTVGEMLMLVIVLSILGLVVGIALMMGTPLSIGAGCVVFNICTMIAIKTDVI